MERIPISSPPADDRDVAVAVGGEPAEGVDDLFGLLDGVGIGRHVVADEGGPRVGSSGRETDEVALGEDADRAGPVHDDHGPHAPLVHPGGRLGDGLRRRPR